MNASWALRLPVATAVAVRPVLGEAHVLGLGRPVAERGLTPPTCRWYTTVPSRRLGHHLGDADLVTRRPPRRGASVAASSACTASIHSGLR